MQASNLASRRRHATHIAATIFLAPALLFLIIFIGYPILDSFRISTLEWNGISAHRTFIGLDNWGALLRDRNFWAAFRNNLTIMVFSLLFQVPFALALATFLDAGGKKFNLFKVVWFFPLLMSSVAVGFLFRYALDANFGLFANISRLLGGSGAIDLLGDPNRALFAVIGVICWQYIPFYMVYYLAGYSGLSEDTYEAAIIDGATRGQYFWRVALPQLFPTIRSGAILSIVGSLKFFDLIFVMTGGGPGTATELMGTYMYRNAFMTFRMGYGSAVACGMFILITMIALIAMKLLSGKEAGA
ncbi:MAG: sugar ABC transporter permease [Oscillospiraceae bacterium]|nr:sugar ABC transporter permease [Oscillospiraceae bacterium]